MSYNAIRENKILVKISESTVAACTYLNTDVTHMLDTGSTQGEGKNLNMTEILFTGM